MAKSKAELKIVVSNDPPEPPPVEMAPEQVEMPFAVVNGEPLTQLPRDLYIPPQALEVFLEAFEGPLDLLLYLIRKQNLDILDIPLAEITRQYMEYIELMEGMQFELAGEYMVMAATLAEIKSRMLLPRPKVDDDGVEDDPRAELVRRLQEYERFKRAAEDIDSLPRLERDVWQASADLKDRQVVRLLPQITLQEMLLAFKDVVIRSEMFAHHHIQRERLSVRARMGDILTLLEHSSFAEFIRLFRPEEGRMGVTVTFMAILELVREGLLDIVQAEPFAPLHVRATGAARNLRVVSDNDAAVAEPAVAIVETLIEDLPLDPNFIDDSDDSEDADAPLAGVDDLLPAVEAKAPPVDDAQLEGEGELPAAGVALPDEVAAGLVATDDLTSEVDETLIVVDDRAPEAEALLPAVEVVPAESRDEQSLGVEAVTPLFEAKLPGSEVELLPVADALPELEGRLPGADDAPLDVDDIPALVEGKLPMGDESAPVSDDSLADVDYAVPVTEDTPTVVSVQEVDLVEGTMLAADPAAPEAQEMKGGIPPLTLPKLPEAEDLSPQVDEQLLGVDTLPPEANDMLSGADQVPHSVPDGADHESPGADDDLPGGGDKPPSPDEASS